MRSTPQALLSRMRDPNDHEAWRQFDAHYRDLLINFCRRRGFSHVDSEDLVQGVFISLSRSLPQFIYDPNRGRFRDYLFKCVRNAIFQWSARHNRHSQPLVPDRESDESGTAARIAGAPRNEPEDSNGDGSLARVWEEEWVAHHYRLAMRTIRTTFDERSLAIFEQSIAGKGIADLAAELGMTEQAVRKVRQRIRERMEELIAQQIREEDEVDDVPGQ